MILKYKLCPRCNIYRYKIHFIRNNNRNTYKMIFNRYCNFCFMKYSNIIYTKRI